MTLRSFFSVSYGVSILVFRMFNCRPCHSPNKAHVSLSREKIQLGVWMFKEAIEQGAAEKILPLNRIAQGMIDLVQA